MQRAHKTRLYPTRAQEVMLAKTAGTARYAYNVSVDRCEAAYRAGEKHPSGYDLRKVWVSEHPDWANEVAASCIYSACLHVDAAYKAFFQHRNDKPTHHKKGKHDSFTFTGDKGRVCGNRVRIPGVGYVKMAEALRYDDCRICSYAVFKRAGKWYVSIQCEILEDVRTESTSVVGVDVGIKHWAVSSDGTILDEPGKLKYLRKQLRHIQQSLSRKKKGSNRRKKAKLRLSKAYQKIDNIKKDAIHKFTATIAKNHGVVVLEDLCVEGMRKGVKSIRKGVQNSAMGEIHRQLMYKCNNFIKIGRYFPSSKTCSRCGNVNKDLSLDDRTYHCPSCGHTIDRDLNAAKNILAEGLKVITEGHSGRARGDCPKDR